MLKYLMAIWNILQTFGNFYVHLVHFVLIWYIFPVLVSRTKKNLATLLEASWKSVAETDAIKAIFQSDIDDKS
jgi:hypothetical protein